MRTKTIILGAIAALALATLSANAGNRATHQAQGSLVSLVAATSTVAKADTDAASAAKAKQEKANEAVTKPVVVAKPAPNIAVSAACQDAIRNLKALRQADATEDATERASAGRPPSASAIEADKAEDATEKQQWRTALLAARTACLPQPSAACQAAITALQALKANGTEDWREWADQHQLSDLRNINWQAQLASLRTAVSTVATACGDRD